MSAEPHDSTGASDQGSPDLFVQAVDDHRDAAPLSGSSARGRGGQHLPPREEYVAPAPARVDATAPEEALRDPPLPEGFLTRLRRVVDDLPD